MLFKGIVSKIKNVITKKRTRNLLTRYANALFPSEAPETYRKASFQHIYTFQKEAEEAPDRPFAFLLFCTSDCFSDQALIDVVAYVKQGVQVMVVTDEESFPLLVRKRLKPIAKNPQNSIYIAKNTYGIKTVLQRIVEEITADTIFCVSGNTGISKNILNEIANIPIKDYTVCTPYDPTRFRRDIENDFSFASFSGIFVQKKAFADCLHNMPDTIRFWAGKYLLPEGTSTNYLNPVIQKYPVRRYIIELFAHLTHHLDSGPQCVETLLPVLQYLVIQRDLSKLHIFLLATTIAYLLYKYDIQDEDLKEKISNIFNFGSLLDEKRIWVLLDLYEPILQERLQKKYDALVIENYGMDDIYNSPFFKTIQDTFAVKYLKKRTNFTYYAFNNLLLRLYAIASKVIISSGSLNKHMVGPKAEVLTLWHGLGLLKETVVKEKKFTVGTIICSSRGCESYYQDHFHATKAIGLGSIQTDILHDKDYREWCRKKIRETYAMQNERLVFFAPTFRLGKPYQYYDFGMDIEALSQKLVANNIKIIAKKHYIFDHVFERTHQDTSGLHNSENQAFILDTSHTFTELVCACDVFVTDYSSGIFYAAVLEKPLVLYAPDVEAYEKSDNGFIIRYPEDIPATAVLEADSDLLINALLHPSDPTSHEYQDFRKLHVEACDGHVNHRVFTYFSDRIRGINASFA